MRKKVVAIGSQRTYGIKKDGTLQEWGISSKIYDNQYSTIKVHTGAAIALRSDGTIDAIIMSDTYNQKSDTPTDSGYLDVAAGGNYNLAIDNEGYICGWGRDYYNSISGIPQEDGFLQVETGGADNSVALNKDGTVVSWGRDLTNLLDFPDGTDFIQVSAGNRCNGALKSNGEIVTWGYDWGAPTDGGYVQLSLGYAHGTALKEDGSIVAWGDDTYGQVSSAPVSKDFVQVVAGYRSTIALKRDGSIVAWGENNGNKISDTPNTNDFWTFFLSKVLVSSNSQIYYYSQNLWKLVGNTEQDYLDYGMNPEYISTIPASAWKELINPTILYYTDDPDKNEITIETETEPFTIYDEMGDSMEVLYYTDDPEKEEAELEITANYSPLDELEGDFEVVTWTDEEDSGRVLKLSGLPVPQFISKTSPENINGYLQGINVLNTDGESKGDMYRILLSPDKNTWKTWNGSAFVNIDTSDNEIIKNQGIKLEDLSTITVQDWESWDNKLYIGVFIDEDIGESDEKVIETINIKELSPTETTRISNAKLYILNTKSTIDVKFAGSTVIGHIDDADLGKVQYRVLLNGEPYLPKDGSFTDLQPSPLNISVTFSNDEILIDQNNNLRIEFQDYWGSTDFWETNFIGTYSGLMFIDPTGDYYSTDIGEILKYLDFGIIIAGQTTLGQKVTLRNTYGYPVENIKIRANTENFPIGMRAEFSKTEADFESLDELSFDEVLENGEEKEFYIRLTTQLGTTPNAQGQFDIIVTANRVV